MNRFLSQRGFTLLEIMIVIAIIGIMAAVAIPNIRAWVPRQQIRSVKRDIVSQMQLGRMLAIGSGHYCYIDFDPGSDGVANNMALTSFLDTDDDTVGEVNNGLPEDANEFEASQMPGPDMVGGFPSTRLPGRVSYGADTGTPVPGGGPIGDGVTFSGDRAVFYPNGRGKLGSVYIRNDRGESFAITVNIIGRVIVRKWNGAAWH